MSDHQTSDHMRFAADVQDVAKRHGRRLTMFVSHDLTTGQVSVYSPIDDPRDVQQLARSVLDLVSRDADAMVATGPGCTHLGGKA